MGEMMMRVAFMSRDNVPVMVPMTPKQSIGVKLAELELDAHADGRAGGFRFVGTCSGIVSGLRGSGGDAGD